MDKLIVQLKTYTMTVPVHTASQCACAHACMPWPPVSVPVHVCTLRGNMETRKEWRGSYKIIVVKDFPSHHLSGHP